MKRFATIQCLAALTLCVGANAEVYKWTDKEGRVHYSDKAPEGAQSEEVSEQLRDAVSTYTPGTPVPEARPTPTNATGALRDAPQRATPVVVEIIPVEFELTRAEQQQIRDEVQHIYRSYVELFDWSPRPRMPVKIRIFGRLAAWNAYPKTIEPALDYRSHYSPATGEVVMHGTRFNIEAIEVMRHEVSHAILHMEIGFAPQWINEGLAEFFRTNGPNRAGIEIVKMKIHEGSLEPWARYVDIPFDQWRGESKVVERTYYRIAASMMSFLLSSRSGTKCLRDVLTEARTSGFGVLSQTYERHCGNLQVLDANWRKWVAKQ